jgi:UDP-glucose:(heptosyl)LPS alpha-1,3-glucosyltransferase
VKLAIIRQRYNPYGGAERFVDSALGALIEHNVDVSLYTREWHPTKQTLLEPIVCNPRYLGKVSRDRGFARAVCAAIAQHKPDLVQSHERIACCDIFRAGDGVHKVWLEQRRRHEGDWGRLGIALSPYHRYVLEAEAQLFSSVRLKAVICNSRMVRDELRECYSVPESAMHVIYNAVDCERYGVHLRSHRGTVREALHIPEAALTFLFLGSGYLRKGLRYALEAVARLPDAHLIVVGHDKHLARYGKLAASLGMERRAHFVGPHRQPEVFYGTADAFVLPTLYDPCPNAALEAMASGLPVVTSTKCGAAELVTEHGAGFVCQADDVETLAAHLGSLGDPAARAAMGTGAREAAMALTPDAMARRLLLLYHHLLGTGVGSDAAERAQTASQAAL